MPRSLQQPTRVLPHLTLENALLKKSTHLEIKDQGTMWGNTDVYLLLALPLLCFLHLTLFPRLLPPKGTTSSFHFYSPNFFFFFFTALTSAGNTVKRKRGSLLPPNSPFSRQYHHILTSCLPLLLSALSPSTHTNTLQRSESLLDSIIWNLSFLGLSPQPPIIPMI